MMKKWSLELYQQANVRLDRQGQTQTVIIHHLISRGTIDEIVMRRLLERDAGQEGLLIALRPAIERYGVRLAA
jgi:SNF2 family DNA or RNA helicase